MTRIVVVAYALAGCTHRPASPDASPDASAPPTLDAAAGLIETTAWTEPSGIDALVADCAVVPPRPEADHGIPARSPLECHSALPGQSCRVDPCGEERRDACVPGCETACDGCVDACTTTCGGCKTACGAGDPDCVHTCAAKTGACRDACLRTKDTCSTATCVARAAACRKETNARWRSLGCSASCPAFVACLRGNDPSTCGSKTRCPREFLMACAMSAPDPLTRGLYPDDP